MSKITLQIVAQIRNQASTGLKQINKDLDNTAKSTKKATFQFRELNRALFSARAFFGVFTHAFGDFTSSLAEAANMQRVENSFKETFGQNSDILTSINKFSSVGVDRMSAMQDAISLGMLGIAGSSDDAAKILAGAAYGAKRAGVDTTEAMHKIVQGLKDGSLSGLEYLNTIRSSDPALKAQLELLHKYSGSIGGAVTAQAKYNLILSITNRLSELAKNNNEDLTDTFTKVNNSLSRLKQTFGVFLGKAFAPLVIGLRNGIDKLNEFITVNTKNNNGLFYLAKAVGAATLALGGFYAVLYSIKLISSVLALSSAGFPFLKVGVLGLAASFLLTTTNATTLLDKLKLFGNMIEGVYQLVATLDPNTGIAQIDSSIKEMLEKNHIWTLAQNIARAVSFIQAVVKETATTLNSFRDTFLGFINPLIEKLQQLFGFNAGPWSKSLIDGTSGITKGLGKLLATLGAAYLAFKAFKGVRNLFNRVKGFFEFGRTGQTTGQGNIVSSTVFVVNSQDRPLYVVDTVLLAAIRTLGSMFGGKTGAKLLGGTGGTVIKNIIDIAGGGAGGFAAGAEGAVSGIASSLATDIIPGFTTLIGTISSGLLTLTGLASGLAIIIAGIGGYFAGNAINNAIKGTAADRGLDKAAGWIANQLDLEGSDRWQREQDIKNNANAFAVTHPQYAPVTVPPSDEAAVSSPKWAELGLNKQHTQISRVPQTPTTTAAQLNILQQSAAMDTSKEDRKILLRAAQALRDAMLNNANPAKTGEIFKKAYLDAMDIHHRRTTTNTPTTKRGC